MLVHSTARLSNLRIPNDGGNAARTVTRLTTMSILVRKYLTKGEIHSSKHRAICRLDLKIHACQKYMLNTVALVLFGVNGTL